MDKKYIKDSLNEKLSLLESWFRKQNGAIIAFSGGVDSTFILFLARRFLGKENAIGVISNSESLKLKDLEFAKSFCESFDIQLKIIKTNELSDLKYSKNPIDRCFYCKDHLFHDLQELKKEYPEFEILSGTNYDDLGDYRPGIEAAKKNQVLSPLVECKITKEELRLMAKSFGLPNWDKPASPCLSSRIPYNQDITALKLSQIEEAESILNNHRFDDVRVRHYGSLAKIEVLKKDLNKLELIKEELINQIKALGFSKVEIDSEGLVSGKMNRGLSSKQLNKY